MANNHENDMPAQENVFAQILLSPAWKFLLFCFLLFGLYIALILAISLPLAGAVLAAFGAGVGARRWCGHGRRGYRIPTVCSLVLALLLFAEFVRYENFVSRYKPVYEQDGWWDDYRPFKPGNRLAAATPAPAFRFEGAPPRVNGAYAFYPVYAAAFQALAATPPERTDDFLKLQGSDEIFGRLNREEDDVIFGLRPAPEQIAAMREAGLRYTMTPVLREAFVFFVHKDNPATNLTIDQIRAVYSGRVKSWRELGVPLEAKLVPYQRNWHSGSQTTFERLMGDTPIMEAPRVTGMRRIIESVAYRNTPGALGFSFRFYMTELIRNPMVKLLAIDGVEPTVANIQSGAYPLVSEAYAITARPREGNTAKMIDFLRSPEGRRLVEASGYTPAPEGSEDVVLE